MISAHGEKGMKGVDFDREGSVNDSSVSLRLKQFVASPFQVRLHSRAFGPSQSVYQCF